MSEIASCEQYVLNELLSEKEKNKNLRVETLKLSNDVDKLQEENELLKKAIISNARYIVTNGDYFDKPLISFDVVGENDEMYDFLAGILGDIVIPVTDVSDGLSEE